MRLLDENILIGGGKSAQPEEVMLLMADINYTKIFFVNGSKTIVAMPLKELEKRFSEYSFFFRTHKSFLVNLNYVRSIEWNTESPFLSLIDNEHRPSISRRKRALLLNKMQDYAV